VGRPHLPEVIPWDCDFRHSGVGARRAYNQAMQNVRWLKVAAVATWVLSGIYPLGILVDRPLTWWPTAAWMAAYLLNGAAMTLFLMLPGMARGARPRYLPVLLALTQGATGLLVHYISGVHLDGTGVTVGLLVIVAAEIPFILPYRIVWLWLAVQTGLVAVPYAVGGLGVVNLIGITLAMGGFQVFAAVCTMLLRSEQASREKLAATNADLLATRALLAENSRAAERLRISRDLHDTLGHHLTALSLQLDVASRLTDGKAADHVRQAHAITRLLLADVRNVVGSLREPGHIDVAQAIRALTLEQTGIAIHIDLPPVLNVNDQGRADTLTRCVQEIVTNAMRHSGARNLWIRLDARNDGIAIDAHDDGRGAVESIAAGHGLLGMRERFEQNAGHVEFQWGPGSGFHVRGFLPLPASG
jgi:signal transduction histidine kinase